MYDVETYWSGEEGVVKTYYFQVNGDIEAKTQLKVGQKWDNTR